METTELTEIIYKYYPQGIARFDPAYDLSSEHKLLIETIGRNIPAPLWGEISSRITILIPEAYVRTSMLPISPSCQFQITGLSDGNFRYDVYLFISVISNHWTMYFLETQQIDEEKATAIIEQHASQLQAAPEGERQSLIISLIADELGTDTSLRERSWTTCYDGIKKETDEITQLLEKYGYEKFHTASLFEIVPNISTSGHDLLNTSTFFDCLFWDLGQIR